MLSKFSLTLLLACGAFGAGYISGSVHTKNAIEAEQLQVANANLEKLRSEFEAQTRIATEQAVKDAVAKEKSRQATSRGIIDAQTKTNPACNLGGITTGLLNDAINAANGQNNPSPMRGAVPPTHYDH